MTTLVLPSVGGDDNAWGTKLNAALTTLAAEVDALVGGAVGARLASASLVTGSNLTSLGSTLTDVGLTIAPVIGARGVDLDLTLPVIQGSANATFVIALIDVTAGTQIDQGVVVTGSGGWAPPLSLKCDTAPAAGTRTYKVQAKCLSGTADIAFYGADTNTRAALTCTQR